MGEDDRKKCHCCISIKDSIVIIICDDDCDWDDVSDGVQKIMIAKKNVSTEEETVET